jgi:hypothetical protein
MLQINKLVIIWQVLLSELKEVMSEPSGVRLILKDDYTKPLIALIDSSTRSWFGQHIFKYVYLMLISSVHSKCAHDLLGITLQAFQGLQRQKETSRRW